MGSLRLSSSIPNQMRLNSRQNEDNLYWIWLQHQNNQCMIPPFDHNNNVRPPFLESNPTSRQAFSPYKCSIGEFCRKFAVSDEHINILKKYVEFRLECFGTGIHNGFQWIDGSFVEDTQQRESREPHDIDVVSFIYRAYINPNNIIKSFPEFINPKLSKNRYLVDHYIVVADLNPEFELDCKQTDLAYWNICSQEISEKQEDIIGVFKGALLESGRFEYIDEDGKVKHGRLSEDLDDETIENIVKNNTNKTCKMHVLNHMTSSANGKKREVIELLSISEVIVQE